MGYLGAVGRTSAEKIIEKSRFIAYCARTAGEQAARAFLSELHALHPLATHICYGFIADDLGNLQRFSDDGEPQGTAGMPILNVLRAQELRETAVAVVRYFGGIKLGAGGLTRAYSSVASLAVASSQKCRFEPCVSLEVRVAYPDVGTFLRFAEGCGLPVTDRVFSEEAVFTVAVEEGKLEAVCGDLRNALSGRVVIKERRRFIHPFPME